MNTRVRNRLVAGTLILAVFTAFFPGCGGADQMNYGMYYSNGKRLYEKHCQNCHAADGRGLGALIPPLTDTIYLRHNREKLVCIVKSGMKESVEVDKKVYFGEMPGNPGLAPIDIAQVLTYITNSFGNKQGLYDVADADRQCRN